MTAGIFLFELKYRSRRRNTYVFFVIIFCTSFFIAASPNALPAGLTVPNAPSLIALYTALLSFFFTLITAAVMGAPVIRDLDHNFEPLLYAMPVNKYQYLIGRFLGSFLVLMLINAAMPLGLMAGYASATVVPWRVGWAGHPLLPFTAWHFVKPFIMFTISSLYVTSALYFIGGALSRKTLVIYTQGIVLLILYQIGYMFTNDALPPYLTAAFDPFGIEVLQQMLKFWSVSDLNRTEIPLSSVLLFNRTLWVIAGTTSLAAGLYFFRMRPATVPAGAKDTPAPGLPSDLRYSSGGSVRFGLPAAVQKIFHSAKFYVRLVVREMPFLSFLAAALMLLIVNILKAAYQTGDHPYMTTANAHAMLGPFNTIILMMVLFYSGELLWIEKTHGINPISQTLPVPDFFETVAKMAALTAISLMIIAGSLLVAIGIQFSFGYFIVQPLALLVPALFATLPSLLLTMMLSVFIQVIANNKFLGFTLCILAFLVLNNIDGSGIENQLFRFGSGNLVPFSEMNGYQNLLYPYIMLKVYWLAVGSCMVMVSFLWIARGTETSFVARLKKVGSRVNRPWLIAAFGLLSVALSFGIFIQYKTHTDDRYESNAETAFRRKEYGELFGRFKAIPQPVIVKEEFDIALFPKRNMFTASGTMVLKNNSLLPMEELLVVEDFDPHLQFSELQANHTIASRLSDRSGKIHSLHLATPLQPGEEITLTMACTYFNAGFLVSHPSTSVVPNGTYLQSSVFPKIGYDPGVAADLHPVDPLHPYGFYSGTDESGKLLLRITADSDQQILAPGRLQATETRDARTSYTFAGNIPEGNQFCITSGKFQRFETKWSDRDITILHTNIPPAECAQLTAMIKRTLTSFSILFPAAAKQNATLVQIPTYHATPLPSAGIFPVTENLAFTHWTDSTANPLELSMAYWTVFQQFRRTQYASPSQVPWVRAFSHYYADRFLAEHSSKEARMVKNKQQLKNYLTARQGLSTPEPSLETGSAAQFLYDTKAPLGLHRLESIIGRAAFDSAFMSVRNYTETSNHADLIKNTLKSRAPDSLKHLVDELFDRVILYDNSIITGSYSQQPNGTYTSALTVLGQKGVSDKKGLESSLPFEEWIDIGFYSREKDGRRILSSLKKIRIRNGTNTVQVVTAFRPESAVLDPFSTWLDTQPENNGAELKQLVDLTDVTVQ